MSSTSRQTDRQTEEQHRECNKKLLFHNLPYITIPIIYIFSLGGAGGDADYDKPRWDVAEDCTWRITLRKFPPQMP